MTHSPKDLIKGLSPQRIAALAAPRPKPDPTPPKPPAPPKDAKRGRGSILPMFQPKIPQATVDAIRTERDAGHRGIDIAAKHQVTPAYVSLVTHNLRRASGGEGGAQ
jgi:hypothetical protein